MSFGARVPLGPGSSASPVEMLVLELGRPGCAWVWHAKERVPWGPAGLPVLAAGLWRVPCVGPERPTGGRLRAPGGRRSVRVALCPVDRRQPWGGVWGRQASGVPRVPRGDLPGGPRPPAPRGPGVAGLEGEGRATRAHSLAAGDAPGHWRSGRGAALRGLAQAPGPLGSRRVQQKGLCFARGPESVLGIAGVECRCAHGRPGSRARGAALGAETLPPGARQRS